MVGGYPHDIVLTSGPLGGLGDLLLYSTLAERFTAEGHDVYLHRCEDTPDSCPFECVARNDEVYALLWSQNPFIRGYSPKAPNAGHTRQGAFYDQINRLPLGCAIEGMERAHGLPPPYSMAPKVYYVPKPYPYDLSNVVVMDMHSLSSAIDSTGWARFHTKMVDRFGPISLLTFPPSVVRNPIEQPPGVPTYGVDSIYTYCDILSNCRAWVGSEAGGQALAAAIRGEADVFDLARRPEIVCLMAPNTFNSRAFCFRGVDYHTSKFAAGDDYLEPVEVPYHRYHEACRMNIEGMRSIWRQSK